MKNFFSIAAVIAILSSCAANNKLAQDQRKLSTLHSKENMNGCFVKLIDGTIKNYHTLKLVTGVFTSPHLVADDSIKIVPAQIISYQNADHYAVSQKTFTSGRVTCAAVETLPGFAVRIAKGSVNVYCKKFFNGNRAVDEFYVQKGDDGEIVAFKPEMLSDFAKTNPEIISTITGKKETITKVRKDMASTQTMAISSSLTNK